MGVEGKEVKGIYFINEKINLKGLSEEESFALQKKALSSYIHSRKIHIIKLNPFQLYEHYAVPHALFYDLKKEKIHLDLLLMYSLEAVKDYSTAYPARWLMLKSFFENVMTVELVPAQKRV